MRVTTGLWCSMFLLAAAGAVAAAPDSFAGQVTSLRAFRDAAGRIRTEVTLTTTNASAVPNTHTLTIAGGELDGVQVCHGETPRFLLNQLGTLSYATDTGQPIWTPDSGSTAALADPSAGGDPIPYWYDSRFVACDRGDPILYRVDTNALPTGITPARALQAVANALQAWANVSSARFQFDGTEAFGAAAPDLDKNDYRFWIQLYNYGNYITNYSTLGNGGYSAWGLPGGGGQITGTNFYPSAWGYLILNHTNSFFSNNPTNLEEVLTHELGHALSLNHSADTNAIMYPIVFGNGRGARISTSDVTRLIAMYPTNTPPYGLDRIMHIITRSPTQITPQVGTNAVVMGAYDLQSTNLTIVYDTSYAPHGTFSTNGNVLGFTPSANYDAAEIDPSTSSYYEYYQYRVSDGTNRSATVKVRVMAFFPDSADNDYLPTYWETLYPPVHTNGVNGDMDRDGFTNYQEWLLGTNPTNATSRFSISALGPTNLTWTAKPYELYEVQSTTNLTSGFTLYKPVVPTSATGSVSFTQSSASNRFFRVKRIP